MSVVSKISAVSAISVLCTMNKVSTLRAFNEKSFVSAMSVVCKLSLNSIMNVVSVVNWKICGESNKVSKKNECNKRVQWV